MNVLSVNAAADTGGAGRALCRLHQGLKQLGHESPILARSHEGTDQDVLSIEDVADGWLSPLVRTVDSMGRRMEAHAGIPFSRYQTTKYILKSALLDEADILHLHNIHGGYFNYHLLPALSERKPIVWTLHDMWALTGHCAYPYDCQRWKTGCHDCPLLKGPGRNMVEPPPTRIDRTRQVWRTKRRLYRKSQLHIVTPSQWLCEQVKTSILADTGSAQCIPNGLDLEVFRPRDPDLARRALDVPTGAKTILFVAQNTTQGRKGFQFLLDALERIQDLRSVVLMTIGAAGVSHTQLDRFRRRDLGRMTDEVLLSLVYSAADLFVLPTLADNLPVVLQEAMACGTPMVAFDVGGVPELVRHLETGYLARYKDVEDLAHGIRFLLEDGDLRADLGQQCRSVAEAEYSLVLQASRYVELYERVLQQRDSGVQA